VLVAMADNVQAEMLANAQLPLLHQQVLLQQEMDHHLFLIPSLLQVAEKAASITVAPVVMEVLEVVELPPMELVELQQSLELITMEITVEQD
jgi:hypothetical protein